MFFHLIKIIVTSLLFIAVCHYLFILLRKNLTKPQEKILNGGEIIINPPPEMHASKSRVSKSPASESPASKSRVSESPASESPASESRVSESRVSESPASESPASESPAAPKDKMMNTALDEYLKTMS